MDEGYFVSIPHSCHVLLYFSKVQIPDVCFCCIRNSVIPCSHPDIDNLPVFEEFNVSDLSNVSSRCLI